mmetsp:Transcript_1161/g.1231  ORF Transcript_1161/g.1231 Transcript_1161/m.1231 type:complete len:335 (+) Transcript_1161:94-1098(+)|eukprot:CAMPEP_0115011110 /NCGR_PEP_ID=MMETSP0216-20121206/23775_1 /TAXON_ID=223996 /ORGANISM="Protocruzia adherens, Strain Boccale" /LENGTH=334 /DNA_ID=CAMNT_0002379571 /DNA_START=53 /DNA_END=1057 /DNA_ORIENTATION=+
MAKEKDFVPISLELEVDNDEKEQEEVQQIRQPEVTGYMRLLGIGLMLLGQFFMFIQFFMIKILATQGIQVFQIVAIRGAILVFWNTIIIKALKLPINLERSLLPKLFLRGFFGFLGYITYVEANILLKLSEAQSLLLMTPFISAILGRLFLSEHLQRLQITAILLSFVGVITILRPSFLFGNMSQQEQSESAPLYAYCFPLLSAFFGSCAFFQIRSLGSRVHFVFPVYSLGIFIVVLAPMLQYVVGGGWKSMSWGQWGIICVAGTLGWLAQILLSRSLQIEKLAISVSMVFLQVPLSMIADSLYFSFHVFGFEIAGALIVFGGLVLLTYSKIKS